MTLGVRKKSFGNNAGKPQPIRIKFATHAQVRGDNGQKILGAIGKWGQNGGGTNPAQPDFCLQNEM